MVAKNVIVTSFRLSAIGWFTGVLSEIHKAIYGIPINWNYEISRFECTRERRPLPQGFSTVWNANPLILANRGFDKVLFVKRPLLDILEACCWYDKQKSYNDIVLEGNDEEYLNSLTRNYLNLYDRKTIFHDNIIYVDIEDLNRNTMNDFHRVCDCLGFDMSKFPIIVPVRVQKEWEVYGGYNMGNKLNERLKLIKEAKLNGNVKQN